MSPLLVRFSFVTLFGCRRYLQATHPTPLPSPPPQHASLTPSHPYTLPPATPESFCCPHPHPHPTALPPLPSSPPFHSSPSSSPLYTLVSFWFSVLLCFPFSTRLSIATLPKVVYGNSITFMIMLTRLWISLPLQVQSSQSQELVADPPF